MPKALKKQARSRICYLRKMAREDMTRFRREWLKRMPKKVSEIWRRANIYIDVDGIRRPAAVRVIEDVMRELKACGQGAVTEMGAITYDRLCSELIHSFHGHVSLDRNYYDLILSGSI